jgi:hypothetical protein
VCGAALQAILCSPIRKTRFASDGKKPWLRGSCERQPLDFARGPELVERASGRRLQIHPPIRRAQGPEPVEGLALVATNQMPFPRRL